MQRLSTARSDWSCLQRGRFLPKMALGLTVIFIVCSLFGGGQSWFIGPRMFTYINDIALEEYHQNGAFSQDLHKKLLKDPIQEITGSLQGFFQSELSYILSDLKVVEYDPLGINYSLSEPDEIVLLIHAPRVKIEGKHSINQSVGGWQLRELSGEISIIIKDIKLRLIRDVRWDRDNKLKWVSSSANVSVDDIKIDLKDESTNELLALVNQQDLRKLAEAKILASHMLLTDIEIDNSYNINDDIYLDVEIIGKSIIENSYLKLQQVGKFQYRDYDSEFPDREGVPILPDISEYLATSEARMAYLITNFVLDSLGWIIHEHHLLACMFTDEDLPENQRELLATTCDARVGCFGEKFPDAATKFPDSTVWFNVSSAKPLKVTNMTNVITSLNVDAHARQNDGTNQLLFSVGLRLVMPIEFKIINSRLHIMVERSTLNITFHENNIGDISVEQLEPILEPVLQKLLGPVLDWLRREGLPLIVPKSIIVTDYKVIVNKRNVVIVGKFVKEPRQLTKIVHIWDEWLLI